MQVKEPKATPSAPFARCRRRLQCGNDEGLAPVKRRLTSLHYCNLCKATTRHSEGETTSVCLRCGAIKNLTRVTANKNTEQQQNEDARWN
jgi:hypothetical protein